MYCEKKREIEKESNKECGKKENMTTKESENYQCEFMYLSAMQPDFPFW